MTTHVFITGGAGFIGSRLAEQLAQTGARVSVFDNFHPQVHAGNPVNRKRLINSDVQIIEGDVRNAADLTDAIKKTTPEIVYHLAAETGTGQSFDMPAHYSDVNVTGTAHLIEAIRASKAAVGRVILAGSRAVYGEGACVDDAGRPTPAMARHVDDLAAGDFAPKDKERRDLTPVPTDANCPVNPASVYASTKLMQEYLLAQAFWGSDTDVGILRLQNVYGPGQSLNNPYTGVLSIFTHLIAEGQVLEIYEDGNITRDFVLVDDVVSAFVRMAQIEKLPDGILDIGSGQAVTVLDVARHMLRLMKADPNRVRISGNFRPGDIRHAVADISEAQTVLGWQPENDLATGLERLIKWSQQPEQDI